MRVHRFETRSFPNSLAATLHGFTFYLADPSARLRKFAQIQIRKAGTKERISEIEGKSHRGDRVRAGAEGVSMQEAMYQISLFPFFLIQKICVIGNEGISGLINHFSVISAFSVVKNKASDVFSSFVIRASPFSLVSIRVHLWLMITRRIVCVSYPWYPCNPWLNLRR
jgi:hypothetical protein